MPEKFSAVFENSNRGIKVFYRHRRHNAGMVYLGTFDTAEETRYIYEGEFVFNLAAGYIADRYDSPFYIPLNVLREIADFGAAQGRLALRRRRKSDLSDAERPKRSAVFEKRDGDILVHYVNDRSGRQTYLGTIDRADLDDIYEGEFVFNLAAGYIADRYDSPFYIPLNVLMEIDDYGTSTKNEAEYLDPFTRGRRPRIHLSEAER